MITIFFDGLCEPVSPGGVACFGWAVHGLDGPLDVVAACGVVGAGKGMTGHYAEWVALGKALGFLAAGRFAPDAIAIVGSSPGVINALMGDAECPGGRLRGCRDRCVDLLKRLGCRWKAMAGTAEQNVQAAHLARAAYLGHTGKPAPVAAQKGARV